MTVHSSPSLPRRFVREIVGSLENRLIGALTLIVACTVILNFISQDRSFRLREQGEALQLAASNVERAEHLVDALGQLRYEAGLLRAQSQTGTATGVDGDRLLDLALSIDAEVNALRTNGMDLPRPQYGASAFEQLDRHVEEILGSVGPGRAAARLRQSTAARDAVMAQEAAMMRARAARTRDAALHRINQWTGSWRLLVTLAGSITIALVLAILFDLLRNILPSLRRLHEGLRRLADGDLDFEIGRFALRELQDLSGSIETFRRNAQAVQSLAFTDPSSGMPNRRAFVADATARLHAGPRLGERGFAVLVADIDRFKHINDDYGHSAGDLLVQLVGARMIASLGDGAIVARVGGDEFALCVPLETGKPTTAMTSALLAALREPFDLGDFAVVITCSLGLVETWGGNATGDLNELLEKADLALYAAKNAGRNRCAAFTSELEEQRQLNRALERDLALALTDGQFRLVYQPILPVAGQDHEVEALVRWRHPVLGEISPARFIPAAERCGLMVPLGSWIVEQALADLTRWPGLGLSINLSPLQLQQDGFVGFMLDQCRRHAVDPRRVILEVTESLSIERNTRALTTLELLRGAGFRIALDDFGTGYSSLCMMKNFRFDRLKLDRSLVSDIHRDITSRAVFDAAVAVAVKIGAEVVAEGVSDESLVDPVRNAGCTHIQGYLYSRPIEAGQVAGFYGEDSAEERRVA